MEQEEFDKRFINLDECVILALELFINKNLPFVNSTIFKRPLVVGSGNAAITGKIIFQEVDAIFCDESNYESKLDNSVGVDGAILINASGAKHGPIIAENLKRRGLKVVLFTCNPNAPASRFCDETIVFPKNPEPYTYNTSTYIGMIMSKTRENPKEILDYIKYQIDPLIPKDLSKKNYNSFYFLIPEKFYNAKEMFLTKFDELFGSKVSARGYTIETTKHAKTIIPSDKELFVSFSNNKDFGTKRLILPIPENADYGMLVAIGYYFIGKIQRQNYPWFKDNVLEYCRQASIRFGSNISPIAE